ncbi:MAG: glycosyltransferase family 39 protein, partial [Bryobacteraceae bacterium]
MIRRVLFWPIFVALLVLFLYGLVSERLFDQQVWMPEGLVRLAWFGGAYGAWALAVLCFRPRWFVRATLAAAFIGAALVAGVQAPLAVLFLFASAWALGRLCGTGGVLALLAGLSLYSLLIGLAVLLPVNYRVVYAVAFAIPLVLQRRRLLDLWQADDAELNGRWAMAALGFVLLMHLAVVLGPEVSADGLAMHLAIPASIHTHHQWMFDVRETAWAVLPMAGDWGFTAAYMLGGEDAARLFNFGMLLSAAFMVFRLARRLLPVAPALLTTALFASSPMVQLATGSLFIENFLAAMLTGTVTAMVRFEQSGERRDALTAAVLLGTALATKYGTLAYLAPALILLGLELRRRRALRLSAAIIALILLFGAPPYLGALVRTGNPVFPFLNHIFKSPYFESAAPFVDARFPTPPAIPALFDLTFRTARYFEGQNGGWTFYCFLFAPLAVLLLRPRRADPGWMAIVVGIPAAILTLASRGNVRYLYPVLPLCAVAAAAVLGDLKQRGVVCYRALLATAVAL